MKRFIGIVLAYLVCISSANAKLFDAEEFYLNNGMQVIVVPNHKAPIIKHMVWYKVGAADDPLGKAGTAHLLEHLMFRGTSLVKESEFNRIVSENGGDSNAFTSYDFTAYHEMVDISKLELMMFLEADRMQNLNISKENFQKERDVVYQERKQVVENNPMGEFMEMFRHNLWQTHRYSRPVIGTAEEILSLTVKDARDFYTKYYTPNNAILILSGDIDVKTAKILAEKYYGKIKSREIGEKAEFAVLDDDANSSLNVKSSKVNAARFTKNYIVPSYNTDKSYIYALAVLSKYLAEGETSALYKDLVLNKKAALSVSGYYDAFNRSYATFGFSALPTGDAAEFEKKLDKALIEAIAKIDEKAVEKAKNKMLSGLIYLKDNPGDAAQIVGYMASVGVDLSEIEDMEELIRKVSLKDVEMAADILLKAPNQSGILEMKQ